MGTRAPTRVAVVTGAAGALGSEVARRLAAQGAQVALIDTGRASDRLGKLASELGAAGCPVEADIASASGWESALAVIERTFGARPSHAALVAGGWLGGKPLHAEVDEGVFRSMLELNLETVHRSLRALLPGMVERRNGSIVVVGSRVAERPWTGAGAAAYTASKAAVVALAQAVAAEVLEHGVRVNSVMPSTLDTPANRHAMPDADPSLWVSTTSAAGVIAFLLSDEARDITGAAIPLYGRVP